MGRTCIGGVVHVRGASVGDVAEHLPEAQLLADLDALHHWLAGDAEIGAVDVADTATLMAVAAAAAPHDLLVAAPAGPIGAVFAARAGRTPTTRTTTATSTLCALPALVVCGSATDISRLQVERLAAVVPGVEVLTVPPATGDLVPHVVVELARPRQRPDWRAGGTRPSSSSVATLPRRCWAKSPASWAAPCGRVCRGASMPRAKDRS